MKSEMLAIIPARCGTHSEMIAHIHTHLDVVCTDTPASLHPITRLVSVAWQGFVGELTAKVAS